MKENVHDIVYSHNTVEFVTVAAEFCAYMEQSEGRPCREFVDTVLKLLPLLYLKASLLEAVEAMDDFYPEEFVSEHDYEFVRQTVAAIMGDKDDFLDLGHDDEVRFSDEPVMKTISEELADIYQPVRNFVETYRLGFEPNMAEALAMVREQFELYWGQRLVDAMRELHRIKCRPDEGDEDGSGAAGSWGCCDEE